MLTLTSTESRARIRRTQAALAARDAGQSVWESPQILSLDRWLSDTWAASWPDEQVLHPVQELAQWMACVEADPLGEQLLSSRSIARQLRAADRLVASYHLNLDQAPAWTPEQAAFQRWHRALASERQARGELTQAALPQAFVQRLQAGAIQAPAALRLDLSSAYRLSPAQQQALDALAQAGTRIESAPTGGASPPPEARRFADAQQERIACAQAMAAQLRDLDATATPPRLVIAVANPDAERVALNDALQTTLGITAAHRVPPAWRTDQPPQLADNPWAAAALDILSLRLWDNSLSQLSRLLLSGALWSAERRLDCARLERRLRERCAPRIHLQDLVTQSGPDAPACWQQLRGVVADEPRQASPGEWVRHFQRRLEALGWGAAPDQASAAWQSAEAVREALQQLAVLDRALGAISQTAAVSWLRECLRARRFAPRVEALQPIVICDFAAAAELPADHRWILGADEAGVLGRRLNQPFIARELLGEAQVPGATPTTQLAAATALTRAWGEDTQSLTLSVADLDDTGAERRPTQLIDPPVEWTAATASQQAHTASAPLDMQPEPALPAVEDPLAEGIRGGTGLLKACAQSLFAAMAQYRIGAEPLDEPGHGLSPLLQGQLIHAVLATVWEQLGDSQRLQALDEAAIRDRVATALDSHLPDTMPQSRFPRFVIEAERARIGRLVTAWMLHEQRRSEPFTVLAHERSAELVFEGLPLSLRVDRLDRVLSRDGERLLIIDYKTGKDVKPGGWQADRLNEPQLPLYATPEALAALHIDRADGIAFAHVHTYRRRLASATNWAARLIDGDPTPRGQSDFDELLTQTHARLRWLTQAFLSGQADYTPGSLKDSPLAVLVRDEAIHDETDASS